MTFGNSYKKNYNIWNGRACYFFIATLPHKMESINIFKPLSTVCPQGKNLACNAFHIAPKSWSTGTVQAAPSFKMPSSLLISNNMKFLPSDVTQQQDNLAGQETKITHSTSLF